MPILPRIKRLFGYDAVATTTRRQAPRTDLRSEDDILRWHDRDKMVSSARDAKRNYTVCAWMIRKHLDFVSEFTFEPNTPNEDFNKKFRALVTEWSKRQKCHVAGRHPLRRLLRINEAGRVLDGDILWEKMKAGSVNLVRGDRIRNPRGRVDADEWRNGVRIDPRTQASVEYQIHTRTRAGAFREEKRIPAGNAILNGYFDDADQVRGVSPLSSAINNLRDTYEGIDFALARLKIEQLFGLAVTKNADINHNPFAGNRQYAEENTPGEEDETEEEAQERVQAVADDESRSGVVSFGKGPFQVWLNEGEELKHVTGNMPSSNAQAFLSVCIQLALRSLDLPTSFFDEAHTNFFGSRGALQLYKRSASNKQQDNSEVLDELTLWKVIQWIIADVLELPRGWKSSDIEWQWVPKGIPWWDRSKEIIGDLRAISAGIDNPISVCLDHGTNSPFHNIDQTAKVMAYAAKKGVPISFGVENAPPAAGAPGKDKPKGRSDKEDQEDETGEDE